MKITLQLLAAALIFSISIPFQSLAQEAPKEEPTADPKSKEQEEATRIAKQVVATIDGDPVYRIEVIRQINDAMKTQIAELAKEDPKQAKAMSERIEQAILNETIGKKLMMKIALRDGLDITDEELTEAMTEIAKEQIPGTTLEDFLEQTQIPRGQFAESTRQSIVLHRLVEKHTADLPQPREEAIRKIYDDNVEQFHRLETVHARHILISTKDVEVPEQFAAKQRQADEILQLLEEDKEIDFAKAARQFSQGPSASQGGWVGEFARGQYDPEFEEAAFAMEVGEISDVVKTQHGFHIIKVEEKTPPRLMKFEEVREELVDDFTREMKQERMYWLINRWKKQANIQIKDS